MKQLAPLTDEWIKMAIATGALVPPAGERSSRAERIRDCLFIGFVLLLALGFLGYAFSKPSRAQEDPIQVTSRAKGPRTLMWCAEGGMLMNCRKLSTYPTREGCTTAAINLNNRRDERIAAGYPAGDIAYCIQPMSTER